MIKIKIKRNIKGYIQEVIIRGHANKINDNGNDLVCAGVSAISYGILNSLLIDKVNVDINEEIGFIKINVKDFSAENEHTLKILINSLKTIEEENKKHILIKEEVL